MEVTLVQETPISVMYSCTQQARHQANHFKLNAFDKIIKCDSLTYDGQMTGGKHMIK